MGCGKQRPPVRQGAQPRRGRAAGRRSSPRPAALTPSRPRAPRSAAATSCSRRCSSRATSRSPEYVAPSSEPLPRRHQPAAGRTTRERRVLHDVGAPAARRPLGARARVRGRPARPDDARPRAAEGRRAADQALPAATPAGPTASLVAIDNETGEVRAMVGGADYATRAVQPRHAGPAPAGLGVQAVHPREALRQGISPTSVCPSNKRVFNVRTGSSEKFMVNNYENNYSGAATLANAPTFSDNSVFAHVGIKIGTKQVAGSPSGWASARRSRTTPRSRSAASSRASRRWTSRTPTRRSRPAACASPARSGAGDDGPVGIRRSTTRDDGKPRSTRRTRSIAKRVLPPNVADETTQHPDRSVEGRHRDARAVRRRPRPARRARPRTTATPGSSATDS